MLVYSLHFCQYRWLDIKLDRVSSNVHFVWFGFISSLSSKTAIMLGAWLHLHVFFVSIYSVYSIMGLSFHLQSLWQTDVNNERYKKEIATWVGATHTHSNHCSPLVPPPQFQIWSLSKWTGNTGWCWPWDQPLASQRYLQTSGWFTMTLSIFVYSPSYVMCVPLTVYKDGRSHHPVVCSLPFWSLEAWASSPFETGRFHFCLCQWCWRWVFAFVCFNTGLYQR